MRPRLFTPGPTPIPDRVTLALAEPIIHHRSAEFIELFARVNKRLKYLFQTKSEVYTLTSSGTGAMETSIVNLLCSGDHVITVNGGKFGERWGEMCRIWGINVHEIKVEWGSTVTPEQILDALKTSPDAKALFLTHSETSTGVFTDIKKIAAAVRATKSNVAIIVDGITAVGAHEMKMDEWDVDVVITGSQKGLMIPPGLAFIALSDRAWKLVEASTIPKFYFDLKTARKALETGDTPWTPAITLVVALERALAMLETEGIEQVWARHARLTRALHQGVRALGLKFFDRAPSHAVTTVFFPESIDNKEFMKRLKHSYGVSVAGGQDQLKDKAFRISHLGYYDEADMLAVLAAVEYSLRDVGYTFTPGAGVGAAQAEFLKA